MELKLIFFVFFNFFILRDAYRSLESFSAGSFEVLQATWVGFGLYNAKDKEYNILCCT